MTPENVTTSIVDGSLDGGEESLLRAELKHANVVCIVYTATDDITINSVTERFVFI